MQDTNSWLDSMNMGDQSNYDDLVRQNVMDMGTSSGSSVPPPITGNDWAPGTPQANGQIPQFIPTPGTAPTPVTNSTGQVWGAGGPGGNVDTTGKPMSFAPSAAPAPAPAPAPTPKPVSNTLPPELVDVLKKLQEGLTNFQAPQISFQPQTTPAYDDLVRQAIMNAIQQNQQPVSANDPLVAPMLSAIQAQSQRAKEQNQSQLAERLSAQHLLGSGAYDTGIAGYNQGIDEGASNSIAQLMTNVLSQRQQQLQQAIQMGANYLNADQARQLQTELANVNAALATYQAKSSVGLGTLEALLNNEHFYDQLGAQLGEFAQNQNNQSVQFPVVY